MYYGKSMSKNNFFCLSYIYDTCTIINDVWYLLSCYLLPGWKVEPCDVEEVSHHPPLDVNVKL